MFAMFPRICFSVENHNKIENMALVAGQGRGAGRETAASIHAPSRRPPSGERVCEAPDGEGLPWSAAKCMKYMKSQTEIKEMKLKACRGAPRCRLTGWWWAGELVS